jgi:S1-C subfamily serine protease
MPSDQAHEALPSKPNYPQHKATRLLKPLYRVLPFVMGILATFAGLFFYGIYAPAPEPLTVSQVEESVVGVLASATPSPPYSAEVYDIILPSLVVIRINDSVPKQDSIARSISRPVFGDGMVQAIALDLDTGPAISVQAQEQLDIGSGVVINEDGAILTAYHVVERAATIDVTFADGTEAGASIVAVMPDNNIAVLQPDKLPEVFAPATLGNPGALRIGDEAYAVGNPLGLAGSISAGVISGLDRTYRRSPQHPPLERLIQFDSAVNMGNSGGPLLNRNGEVIGIVVGPLNPTAQETFIGIGFAVRMDVAGAAAGMPPQ